MSLINYTHQYFGNILFEFIIVIIAFIITGLTLFRWGQKKTKLRLELFFFLFAYSLALLGTTFGQIFNYLIIDIDKNAPIFQYFIVGKFGVFFTALGTLLFHILSVDIFHSEDEKLNRYRILLIYALSIIIMILAVLPLFDRQIVLISSILLLFEAILIYIPNSIIAYHVYKKVESEQKYGLYFIFLIGILFIVFWIIQLSNQLWDLITQKIYGPFWLIHWIFVIIILSFTYLGFIMPKWFVKIVKKSMRV